jgi:hypothetical protein
LLSSRQFSPPVGDENSRAKLLKQLRKDFPEDAVSWIDDPDIHVTGPEKIPADSVDWSDYPEWRASRQLKAVVKVAKKIDKGKKKAAVFADRPSQDGLLIIDGHHHTMGRHDAKKQPFGYVIHVNSRSGPWDTMHDRQRDDTKKDDFGRTPEEDRDH